MNFQIYKIVRKVGKKGVELLIGKAATAESCQAACLRDAKCKFATLLMKGSPKKWKCVKFPKVCKLPKKKKDKKKKKKKTPAVSYKKTKLTALQIGDQISFLQ